MRHNADVVIVGSGAGGAAAAWTLVQQGARVLVLEAGPRFEALDDYPLNNLDWEQRGFPAKPGSQGAVQFGDLGVLDPKDSDLKDLNRFRRRNLPPVGTSRTPNGSGYAHVQGVGGSTLHYVGEAQRIHPRSFEAVSMLNGDALWPISYADLEPFYQEVEYEIGVAGSIDSAARTRKVAYSMSPHPISPGGQALLRAGRSIDRHWSINPRAANSEFYDDRPACNYCGQCSRGCPLGDKGSADVTFIRKALSTGRLTISANTVAQQIFTEKNGVVSHLVAVKNGHEIRVDTPQLMIAAGAVQTPRLLLNSTSSEQPAGLANSSGQVGRNFMETLWWRSAGLVPGLRNSHMGLPADVVDWTSAEPGAVDGVIGGFKLTHTTLDSGLNGPIEFASRMVGGIGADFKTRMRENFGSALSVTAVGQLIADNRSFVALSDDQKDQFGKPVAQINSVLTENSIGLLRRMSRAARQVLGAAGAEIIEEESNWMRFLSTHVFGTARMGDDPASSVVDATGRSHDHPNLWICDASVFPNSGSGEAPSLTIMALAKRTAGFVLT